MTQWIVEGTRIPKFRLAQSLAQQHADQNQAIIPLVKDCGDQEFVIVKLVSPRQTMRRPMTGPASCDGSRQSNRFAPGDAPAWD